MIALVLVFTLFTLAAYIVGAWAGYRTGYEDAEREALRKANRITQFLEELDTKGGEQ